MKKLRDRNLRIEHAYYPRLLDADTGEYICSFRSMEQAAEVVEALRLTGGVGSSMAALDDVSTVVAALSEVVKRHSDLIQSATAREGEP